jgi:hypothetical protein
MRLSDTPGGGNIHGNRVLGLAKVLSAAANRRVTRARLLDLSPL